MMKKSVIDDDRSHLLLISDTGVLDVGEFVARLGRLASMTFEYMHAGGAAELAAALHERQWDAVVFDPSLSLIPGAEIVSQIRSTQPHTPLIALVAAPTARDAVELMRLGAVDVVDWNEPPRLADTLRREIMARRGAGAAEQTAFDVGWSDAQSQRRHLSDILDSMQDAVMSFSLPDRRLIFVSESFERIFGYPVQAFLNDPGFFHTVVHPDDLERALEAMEICRRDGFVTLDHRVIWPDGQVRWLQRRAWVNYDAAGQPVRMNDSARDITERKRVEEALRENADWLRLALDAGAFGTWRYFPATRELQLDAQARAHLDAAADWAMLDEVLARVHPDDRAQLSADIAYVLQLADSARHDTEFRIYHRDQTIHWLSIQARTHAPNDGQDGLPVILLGTIQDVSQRRLMEQELRAGEIRYRNIVEDQIDLVCRYDADLRVTFANSAYCRVRGLGLQEIIGSHIFDTIAPDLHDKLRAYIATLTRDHPIGQSVHPSRQVDGSIRWIEWQDRAIFDEQGRIVEYQGIGRDITEQKLAEQRVARSEQRLRLFVEHAPAAIAMLDRDMRYLAVSRRWLADYHLIDKELVGRSHYEVFPDIPDRWRAIHQRCLSGAVEKCDADPFPRMDGTLDWVRWEIHPWYDIDGSIGGILLFSEVITERIRAEEALRASEEQYRSLIESVDSAIAMFGPEGHVLFANAIAAQSLGTTPEAMIGRTMAELFPPEIAAYQLHTISQVIQSGTGVVHEAPSIVNGEQRWYRTSVQPVRDGSQRVVAGLINAADITAFRAAEAALRSSEQRYRQMFVLNGLPKLIIDPETARIIDANPAAGAFYGYDVATLRTLSIFDVNISPPDLIKTKMAQAAQLGMQACEFIHRGARGEPRNVEVFTGPIEVDGRQVLYSIITDVTEKERAKAELQAAHDQLERRVAERTAQLGNALDRVEAIVNHSGDGILLLDVEHGIQRANYAFAELFGISAESAAGSRLETWFHPDDAPAIIAAIGDVAELHQTRQLEARAARGGDVALDLELSIAPVNRTDKAVSNLVCIMRDVTLRKEQERQSRYHAVLQASVNDAVIVTDMEWRVQSWNMAAERIYGWSAAEAIGQPVSDVVRTQFADPTERSRYAAELTRQGWSQGEFVQLHKNGRMRQIQSSASLIYDERGKPIAILALNRDIADRKRAEAELRQYAAQVEDLYNNAPTGYHSLDGNGVFVQINDTELRWLGYTRDEVIGRLRFADVLTPASLAAFHTSFPIFKQRGEISDLEFELRRKDGSTFHVLLNAAAIYDEYGRYLQSRSTVYDISERKKAQQAVAEERNLLRTVIDTVPDFIYVKDLEHRRVLNNAAHTRLFNGSSPADMIGKTDAEFFPAAMVARFHSEEDQLFATGQPIINREEHFAWSDSMEYWMLTTKAPLRNLQGDMIGLVGITRDVTALKASEAALRESEERYRLLAENVRDVIGKMTPDGIRTFLTPSIYDLAGFTPAELIGRPAFEIVHPDDRAPSLAIVNDALQAGRSFFTVTQRIRHKDGHDIWVEVTNTVVRDAATGAAVELIGIIHDITERRRAEEIIAEERNLLRTVIDAVPDYIYVKDLDHRLVLNNAAHRQGLATLISGNPIGKMVYDIFPEDVAARIYAEEEAIFSGTVADLTVEEYYDLSDVVGVGDRDDQARGGKSWRWSTRVPLRNIQGEMAGLVGISHDITALKLSEAALRESEERYRTTVTAMTEGIVVQNRTGAIELCNAAAERILGLTADQLMGRTSIDPRWAAIHEDGAPFAGEKHPAMVALTTAKPVLNVVMGVHKPDGALTWILVNSQPLIKPEQREPYAAVTTFTDITDRKLAEAELLTLSHRLQLATEVGGIGIWDWDVVNDTLVWDNQAYALDHPGGFEGRQTLLSFLSSGFVHPDDDRRVRATLEAALEGRAPLDTELRIVLPNGEPRYLKTKAEVFRDDEGRPVRVLGVNWDITLLKEAEANLRLALEKEHELGELKSRFISMASHEFRTPLAAILATTETLTIYRDRMDRAQIDIRLDKIRHQVAHMRDIMEDVLQLARMQAGRIEFRPALADLDALCREIVEEYEIQPPYKGRIMYTGSTPALVEFDRRLMRQAVSNLISNALKYSVSETPVEVTLACDETQASISVRDQGIGIPANDLKHLFEPFHRAENVGTISGTGLGLNISRQSIDLHNGDIHVESQVGRGTTMMIVIPLRLAKGEAYDEDSSH